MKRQAILRHGANFVAFNLILQILRSNYSSPSMGRVSSASIAAKVWRDRLPTDFRGRLRQSLGFLPPTGSKTVPCGAPKLTSSRPNDEMLRKDSPSARFQFFRQQNPQGVSIVG